MRELEALYHRLKKAMPLLELRQNEPMAWHTTFRVGGPAALMALPRGERELVEAVSIARELGISPVFVGNGSNLLVDDRGLDAFVIKTVPGFDDCRVEGTNIRAQSGILLSQLAMVAARHKLTGLEFAQGIPGSLGGAVAMNAGAYGGEMKQVVTQVGVLTSAGEVEERSAEACAFSYRHSVFLDGGELVLWARLSLAEGNEGDIREKMAQLARQRREKQPLEYPSAGSTFKRPEGHFAAALIDQCGLKGLRVGDAMVSEKHAGFVVNVGKATCGDVLAVMDQVRSRVLEETGVELEPEVRYLR